MVWIDYVIIIVVALSTFISFMRGLIREILYLVTWICAFFISINYYSFLAIWFTSVDDKLVRNGISITILFIIVLIIGFSTTKLISTFIEQINISSADKILGLLFGILRGVLIVATILFFCERFTNFSQSPDWQASKLIPELIHIIRLFYVHSKSILESFFPVMKLEL